jgi:integrase
VAYKRNGFWHTDVTFKYVDSQGVRRQKRIRKRISIKKQDAIDTEANIRAQIAAGIYDPDPIEAVGSIAFTDFVRDEFMPWSKMQHSAAHHAELDRMLYGRCSQHFGNLVLPDINSKRITDYMQARVGEIYTRKGWLAPKRTTPATVNRELAALKAMFRQAVAWGHLQASPASGISALKEAPNPPRLLTSAEVARLLVETPDHLRAAVGCCVYAGLRKMEVLRLRWQDVDLKEEVLTVVSRHGATTKNHETRRVPLNAPLAKLLRQHPRRLGVQYVFPTSDGKQPLSHLKSSLVAAATRAGIDHISTHQLRHAFVSHALMAGIDPRTVQQWVGHKDLRTTLRYAHVGADHERAAIQRLSFTDDGASEAGQA